MADSKQKETTTTKKKSTAKSRSGSTSAAKTPQKRPIRREVGGAVLLLEPDCTPERLYAEVKALLADQTRCDAMSGALKQLVVLDSADRIGDILHQLATDGKKAGKR